MLIYIFFFLLFCLGSSSRLRRVAANGEKGTWSLARLGSSSTHVKRVFNYRADGKKGSAVCSSWLRTQQKSRKWETRAVSRCCFTHTCKKKKEGEEENVIFSKKIPKNPTLLSSIDDGFILFAAFKIKFFKKYVAKILSIKVSLSLNRNYIPIIHQKFI